MATENPTRALVPELAIHPAIVRALPTIGSGAAVAGGIALRWSGLGRKSLWLDEGYTAWVVSNPWRQIVRIISVDTAPPLYYLLLRAWTQVFGFSEAALRSMSALMATVALFVFVAIARKIFKSPWAATAAICLFAFSFMQIAYAHEARFYSMMTMMGAIDLYLVLLVCDRSSVWRLIALCAAWSASLWTNNMMAVYLACLGLGWLILPGDRKLLGRLMDAIIVTVVAGLTFLPWLPKMLAQTQRLRGRFWAVTPDGWSLARTLGVMQGVHETALPRGDQHLFFIISLLLIGSVLLACASTTARRSALGLFSIGILPILLIYLYSHVAQSIFMERAFLASGVAIPLLMVLPIESRRISRVFAVFSTALLMVLSLKSIPGHRLGEHDEDWRGASAYAISSAAKHRLVVCVSSDGEPLFRYYACDRYYNVQSNVTAAPASFFAQDPPKTMQPVKTDADLDQLRAKLKQGGYDEVVLLASHTWWEDQQQLTLALLKKQLIQIDQRQFQQIVVFRFAATR